MIEQKVSEVIASTLDSLGFEVVKVTMSGSTRKVLEILIDRLDGERVSVGDCAIASRNISAILDVEDIISSKYFLEVGSAGAERPLLKLSDYNRFIGRNIKVNLKVPVNNHMHYTGVIDSVESDDIYILSKGIKVKIEFGLIKNARLVLTDKLFKELLNKSK